MIRNLAFLLLFLMSTAVPQARGHSHEHGASAHDEEQIEALANLLIQIVEFSPQITTSENKSEVEVELSGEAIAMNGPFWQLVRGWIRLYYQELQHDCGNCMTIDEELFMRQAEDQIAKGFLQTKVYVPLRGAVGHIIIGTAGLGARLGKVALVAKATSEVAETVFSKVIGGGGIHIVCNLIDAVILFGSRHVQTTSRIFSWASAFDRSRWANVAQLGMIAASVHRVQRRARFVSGPADVNETALQKLVEANPTRWWGWVKDTDLSPRVRELARTGGMDIERTEVLGSMKRRLLWLKPKANTPIDKAVSQNWLWLLKVQENVLQRSLINETPPVLTSASLVEKYAQREDEVRAGLAQEFSGDSELLIENLLKEVELIFNPEVSKTARYMQASVLESLLGGLMFSLFNQVLEERGELHGSTWKGIWAQARLQWQGGKYASYVYEWADFLRLAALQTDAEKLAQYRYEAMESMLRIFKHMQKAVRVAQLRTVDELFQFEQTLKQSNQSLRAYRPWIEKRVARSWLPWGRQAMCSELHEVSL